MTKPADGTSGRPISLDFQGWFEADRRGGLIIPAQRLEKARTFHYLFVSGFHNESMPFYFRGNVHELRRLGVPPENIHRFHPSSHEPLEPLIERLGMWVEQHGTEASGKIVLIGHSRGACLSLATVAERGLWFRDRLEALFLLQGPFGGTAIADYVVTPGSQFPTNWPFRRLGLARTLATIQRLRMRLGWDAALNDLTRQASRHYWKRWIEKQRAESPEIIEEIARRTYFITTAIDPALSRFPRSELGRILQEQDGPNDAVVATADQSIANFGTRIGPLAAGHTDLVWGLYASADARQDRRAITRAILQLVGSENETAP